MKVGYIQYNVLRNKYDNFRIIEQHLKNIACDIVVLPEFCTSGYLFNDKNQIKTVAEEVPLGESVLKFLDLSKKYKCSIVAGLLERDNNTLYNTAIIVEQGVYIGKYRKIHLSDYEKTFFERGNDCSVFDVCGIKIGVQICFDLWFPEISREQINNGCNLFCTPCNFGGNTTVEIAKIRSIENLTPMIICNRVGQEKSDSMTAHFLGHSSVIDFDGNRLLFAPQNIEISECTHIDFASKKSNIICQDFEAEIAIHYKK